MFEFDPEKSAINKHKHGIDFIAAQALWATPNMQLVLPAQPEVHGEERFLVIGMIAEKHWTAIITPRQGKVRIISVRRSRPQEIALYERKHYH